MISKNYSDLHIKAKFPEEKIKVCDVNSVDESLKRIKNRVEKGGHDIPADDVKRRYNKRFEDLVAVLPYCNEVKLYDNENGFTEKAEYKNGTLIIKSDNIPEWLKELQEYFY